MAHIQTLKPTGVFVDTTIDRKPIVRVTGGDTWTLSANLVEPKSMEPAAPENSVVEFIVSETQFDKPLWVGSWYCGVSVDSNRRDLHWIKIPDSVTKSLRRGSYMFSLRVSDPLRTTTLTEVVGSFLVEYAPTSDIHDVPYKSESSGWSKPAQGVENVVVLNTEYFKSYSRDGVQHYVRQVMSYDEEIGWGADWVGDYVIVDGKFVEFKGE